MKQGVVKKAIKAVSQDSILGYELLFEQGEQGLYGETENLQADNTIAGFLMNNSEKIFKHKQIFLTFTPTLLLRNTPKIFEKDKVVIQIGDNLIIHPLAMPIIQKFYREGYRFAVNDFQFSPKYFSMLEYAEFVRLSLRPDMTQKDLTSVENILQMAHGLGKKCIATDVDEKETYELALKLKFDYVEGNYVAEAMSVKTDKVEYMQGNFFRLVVAVSKDEPDMADIEEIISRDAGLTYSLLKLVNSAYFALRRRTASIRQGIMTMGIDKLRQWVYMLSLKNDEGEGAEEILRMSFLRAKYAETLAQHISECPIMPSEAYMMGMFSALEYMVNAPLEEILGGIPVSDEVKDALLKGEGTAGRIMQLVICYEKADWKKCQQLAGELEIDTSLLSQMYINCAEEVSAIWDSLTTEAHRPGEAPMFSPLKNEGGHLEDVLQ